MSRESRSPSPRCSGGLLCRLLLRTSHHPAMCMAGRWSRSSPSPHCACRGSPSVSGCPRSRSRRRLCTHRCTCRWTCRSCRAIRSSRRQSPSPRCACRGSPSGSVSPRCRSRNAVCSFQIPNMSFHSTHIHHILQQYGLSYQGGSPSDSASPHCRSQIATEIFSLWCHCRGKHLCPKRDCHKLYYLLVVNIDSDVLSILTKTNCHSL